VHARPSAALARWEDGGGTIAGRDVVGGGTWLGVNEAGRFAVVTNVREAGGAELAKASRGGLVSGALEHGLAEVAGDDLGRFNPFNLLVADGDELALLSNRPATLVRALDAGVHGLSNGVHDAPWPKTRAVQAAVEHWAGEDRDEIEELLAALRDERRFDDDARDEQEPVGSPVFIRHPVYGTRCSTVVTVDHAGRGVIAERRFGVDGAVTGETRLGFGWPS
jgi:uncharacterized protein with NRDE domain